MEVLWMEGLVKGGEVAGHRVMYSDLRGLQSMFVRQ